MANLEELIKQSVEAYKNLSPQEKAKHDHEQKRSFVRGMCPSNQNYLEWCRIVDRIIPPWEVIHGR